MFQYLLSSYKRATDVIGKITLFKSQSQNSLIGERIQFVIDLSNDLVALCPKVLVSSTLNDRSPKEQEIFALIQLNQSFKGPLDLVDILLNAPVIEDELPVDFFNSLIISMNDTTLRTVII